MHYPWAQVGRKVVCITRFQGFSKYGMPEPGRTYTIREVKVRPSNGKLYLFLKELGPKDGFIISRFRPATDISIFKKMLTEAPVDGSLEEV